MASKRSNVQKVLNIRTTVLKIVVFLTKLGDILPPLKKGRDFQFTIKSITFEYYC